MVAEGGRIDFMCLRPPYPATGSATELCVCMAARLTDFLIYYSVVDPEFPRGAPTYDLAKFSQKTA